MPEYELPQYEQPQICKAGATSTRGCIALSLILLTLLATCTYLISPYAVFLTRRRIPFSSTDLLLFLSHAHRVSPTLNPRYDFYELRFYDLRYPHLLTETSIPLKAWSHCFQFAPEGLLLAGFVCKDWCLETLVARHQIRPNHPNPI